MAERWTRERRLEHTRNLLLDSAERAFADHGFAGAALDDIAEAAGYTRGAIASHFGAKDDLFLAVVERRLQRLAANFDDVIGTFEALDDQLVDELVKRWRSVTTASRADAALNYEFSLYLLRNPDAHERLAPERERMIQWVATYIVNHVARLGGELRMPAETLARLLVASTEGVLMGSHLDGQDLHEPYLQFVMANLVLPGN
ncbi:AcrR family transcriptional regulator [Mycolicibacterium sp. BK634]|uniref:TetR/AcrR family transcriptional regulator n=1 Tax=Mycolicibacterium sp. BK634 TaxID=2587099 RepID=UPI001614E1F9|nr:TetR family transcriptional regulator [Mycolicibacterium sp. BK634]MBB3750829.1 AcrR family transcriptional regulator [Mycolicibacterium sp. BK634]